VNDLVITPPVTTDPDRAAKSPLTRACSHDEFSPLVEVVVGTALGARLPEADPSGWLNLFGDLDANRVASIARGPFPRRVVEETEEDLQALVELFGDLKVTVHRPDPLDHGARFATAHWNSTGMYAYCPRDLTLVVGSTLIETPSPMRARYFENDALRDLFQSYLRAGSAWISAPKPRLREDLYGLDAEGLPILRESEPAFEAANVLRCGRDVFYQVSGSGNELGLTWLTNTLAALGDYTVHPVRDLYRHTHIDSTLALIRPGLLLANPARATDDNLPAALRGWDRIWCPPMREPVPPATKHPLSSPWIGMNLLMVSPTLAIVDAAQHELIRALERRGVDVLPHTLRHARVLGGGMHCVTLDTVRDGPLDTYLD